MGQYPDPVPVGPFHEKHAAYHCAEILRCPCSTVGAGSHDAGPQAGSHYHDVPGDRQRAAALFPQQGLVPHPDLHHAGQDCPGHLRSHHPVCLYADHEAEQAH